MVLWPLMFLAPYFSILCTQGKQASVTFEYSHFPPPYKEKYPLNGSVAARVCVEVCDPGCHEGQYRDPESGPETANWLESEGHVTAVAMKIWVDYIATQSHLDPGCC